MSHTRILDKDWRDILSTCRRLDLRSKAFLEGGAKMRKSGNENRQESDFNCKAFVDVSAEVIAQFFE